MRKLLLTAIALMVTSCFDLQEEIRIGPGETGAITFTMWMDSSLASAIDAEKLSDSLQRTDPRSTVSLLRSGPFVGISVNYLPVPIDSLSTIDTFLRVERIGRRIKFRKVINMDMRDTLGLYMLFSGKHYVVDLISRKPILKSNATTVIADTFHRWIFPMDSLIRGGLRYTVEAEIER